MEVVPKLFVAADGSLGSERRKFIPPGRLDRVHVFTTTLRSDKVTDVESSKAIPCATGY